MSQTEYCNSTKFGSEENETSKWRRMNLWLVDSPGDVLQVYEVGLVCLTAEWRLFSGLASILASYVRYMWFNIMAGFVTIFCNSKVKFNVRLCSLSRNLSSLKPYRPTKLASVLTRRGGRKNPTEFMEMWTNYWSPALKLYIYIYISYIYIQYTT
jgi:hypothetical protein